MDCPAVCESCEAKKLTDSASKLEYVITNPSKGDWRVRRQVLIAICLNIGHLIGGYSLCWTAPVFQKLQDPDQSPLGAAMTDVQAPWLAAIFHVAAILGSQLNGFISNAIGRKPTLILFAAITSASNIMMIFAANFTVLLIGRMLTGIGGGGIGSGDLVYIGEMASSHLRGIILTSTGVVHTMGSLLMFSIGPYVSFATVQYIFVAFTILHVLGLLWIPESPLYHVIKGNEDDAEKTLIYLGRRQEIDSELKTMIENTKQRRVLYTELNRKKRLLSKWRWLDVFRRRRNRKALAITSVLMIVQEGAGVICILSFATAIFKKAGSSVDPNISTIILGITQICGISLTPFLVEKFGRKVLLIFSTSVCALCMALMAAHFYLELIDHPLQASTRWLPLVLLITFLFGYNAGLGIIPNTLVGEMFSADARSVGSSIVISVCYLTSFATSLTFGYIIIIIGSHAIFIIFTIVNIFGCIFTIKCVPETKGKSLTEIEDMLAR